jgi:hypothetical protein
MTEDLAEALDGRTDHMAPPHGTVELRNRRGVLLGAAVGIGGVAASILASSPPAAAGGGDPVLLGEDNTGATARTAVFYTDGTTNPYVASLGDPGEKAGVFGQDNSAAGARGVLGTSSKGVGVAAVSHAVSGTGGSGSGFPAAGVWGDSDLHYGIVGTSDSAFGVYGISPSDGVKGITLGNAAGVTGEAVAAGTGVAGSSSMGIGVTGFSAGADGIHGSTNCVGKSGVSGADVSGLGGHGVHGTSTAGIAVYADNAEGRALRVEGTATFSRSGIATASGTPSSPLTSLSVSCLGADLTSKSMVLATIQGDGVSGVAIKAVAPVVGTKKFTIHLTAELKTTMDIAWLVLG